MEYILAVVIFGLIFGTGAWLFSDDGDAWVVGIVLLISAVLVGCVFALVRQIRGKRRSRTPSADLRNSVADRQHLDRMGPPYV
jgi:hypothetical protein